MTNPLIGLRLKALRDEHNLSQEGVAEILGIADRQTISYIESGERQAKPEELVALIDRFELDPDYFTDPFRLVGEGAFSWRQLDCSPTALTAYQQRAGRWLAAYRSLSSMDERPGPSERRSLRLWERSTFEQAMAEGERITLAYKMGDVPARRLPQVMEEDFGILVLMVDMEDGISGAACRLPELDAVLVNRRDNGRRRNFDLAHEFFHILTWDTMPPKPVERASMKGGGRVELLANNFAAALLMPQRLLARYGEWRDLGNAERSTRLRAVADHFQVSTQALHWRLVALRLLSATARHLEVVPSEAPANYEKPPLFSRNFARTIAEAIERGRLSVGKAVKLFEQSRDELRALFAAHGVPAPVTI
ncbi:hypothetical protein AO398_14090 [Methylobacterium sp. GXS13]|uniref:helix-turn-helix domain-containing protein n=1 Tax=Methylobacterium sp. GXS13 TaxID=1730094 RepID=UPI00071B8DBF|nr:XRE family transcriptional regulator [Methylobacterium sp. GXS13]KST60440.1 hypothetical protein AO398_14090 [Methylobacterium sp. GXS13]